MSQVCNGSLGDPVVNETFGSGAAIFGPTLADTSGYTYIADFCPADGFYALVHSIGTCYAGDWHMLTQDHTGDPDGYMMVVNASPAPGVFFTYPVHNLCSGSTYAFGAYVINLDLPNTCSDSLKLPNIEFTIETTAGKILADTTTGFIPSTANAVWGQYQLYFKTPPGVSDVVLKMSNANTAPGTCGNDLAIDDITFRSCGPIVSANFNSSNSNIPSELCAGDPVNFNISASVDASSYTNVAYQWQLNSNNNGWNNIAGATKNSYNVQFNNAQAGTYQYRMAVAEAANINSDLCRVVSNVLTVNVNPPPVVKASAADYKICPGDSLQLYGSGGSTYLWAGPAGFTSNAQNPVVGNMDQTKAGKYTVIATSASGCADTASVTVSVYPTFNVSAGNNVTICAGQSTLLQASGGVQYSWSPAIGLSDANIANPVASPADTTIYTVTATSANGCFAKSDVTVNVSPKPVISAGGDKIIFSGQSTQLNGSASGPNVTYNWTPATGLNNANTLNPVARPVNDTYYILHAADSCGTVTDTVFVKVYNSIVIPSAFSPNGDGINDTWNIEVLAAFPQCTVSIYDRAGQLIYNSVGYNKAWNGVYRGRPLPIGTYYYVIDLKNQMPLLSGPVTLIR